MPNTPELKREIKMENRHSLSLDQGDSESTKPRTGLGETVSCQLRKFGKVTVIPKKVEGRS